MIINYNVTGAERKTLVGAISQQLNLPTKYLGAPTFAYEVGEYRIDKTGVLNGPDNSSLVADLQNLHSFVPVSIEYDTSLPETEETAGVGNYPDIDQHHPGQYADPNVPVTEEMLRQADAGMAGEPAFEDMGQNTDSLIIEVPKAGFTEEAIANLEKLVESKSTLIKKVIGADSLAIEQTKETLRFPWFTPQGDVALIRAYTKFVSALCTMAKEQKRITAKEKTVDNEKYAFRCFLLRLGFISEEFKAERKILLSKLTGNSSFKSGEHQPAESEATDE